MTYRLLLDVSSLMYRAFYAIPASVRDPDGRPVNAAHGYLDMVAHLVRSLEPDDTVHAYDDDWRPAPRVAAYAGYKASRAEDPEGLPEQFELLSEALDALGLAQASAKGWEAEDAIGGLCRQGGSDDRFDVVTGDRDLIQLVRDDPPSVRVLFTVRGVSDLRHLDEKGVVERFGVPADRYAEFAILRGDPSDGLPGVRGVGEKTARALISAYPSIEAMIEDASRAAPTTRPIKGSPQLRARLRDAAEYLKTMQKVAIINSEAEVEVWRRDPDEARIDELSRTRRLASPIRRLRAALAGEPPPGS